LRARPTDTLDSSRRLTAEERKAILDQRVADVVARGGRPRWWGGGSFEAVVSYRRYLPARRWDYAFPVLVLGLLVTWLAAAGRGVGPLAFVLDLGVIVLWIASSRYERLTVDEHGMVTVAGAGLLGAAAATTLIAGLAGAIPGGAHFLGVTGNATSGVYQSYDFRLASMLLLGIGMVFAGVLCLTAVRGLAHGQRRAWDRAMIGSVLLLLVTLPITPHPTQGGMAGFLSFFAAVDLIVLLAAWRQLEAGQRSQHASVATDPR
jgi:hypothetical protein